MFAAFTWQTLAVSAGAALVVGLVAGRLPRPARLAAHADGRHPAGVTGGHPAGRPGGERLVLLLGACRIST